MRQRYLLAYAEPKPGRFGDNFNYDRRLGLARPDMYVVRSDLGKTSPAYIVPAKGFAEELIFALEAPAKNNFSGFCFFLKSAVTQSKCRQH